MDRLLTLSCDVDDIYQSWVPQWPCHLITAGQKYRQRQFQLSLSKIMTIIIHFHQSHYHDCNTFYTILVQQCLSKALPNLLSYARWVQLIPSTLIPLCTYLNSRYDQCLGIASTLTSPQSRSVTINASRGTECLLMWPW
jgi:hypothetical protein